MKLNKKAELKEAKKGNKVMTVILGCVAVAAVVGTVVGIVSRVKAHFSKYAETTES